MNVDPLEATVTNFPGDAECPIVVLTVATKMNQGAHNFLASLRAYGYRYKVLGWRQPWQGWRGRMMWYRDACAALPPNQLVALNDAYDVVALRSWRGIDDVFQTVSKGRGIVGGMETVCFGNCTPIDAWWKAEGRTPQQPGVKFVNGGIMIGKASALAAAYAWMIDQGATDDQMGMAAYVNAFPDAFAADDGALLAKNKLALTSLTPAEKNGTGAYFCHFPGVASFSNSAYAIDDAWSTHAGALAIPSQKAWWDWGIPVICACVGLLLGFCIAYGVLRCTQKQSSQIQSQVQSFSHFQNQNHLLGRVSPQCPTLDTTQSKG